MSHRPCKGNTDKLIALMSGSLRPRVADQLRKHMEGCPGCSEAHRRLTQTQGLLRELGQSDPPELPWKQVEAQIHWRLSRPEEEPRSWWTTRLLPLAGAAAVGVVVTLGIVWLSQPGWVTQTTPAPSVVTKFAKPAPPAELELAAVPTMVQGDVELLAKDGRRTPLQIDEPVLQGSQVVTKVGRASLQWAAGSGFLVHQHSAVELKRLMSRSQRLRLGHGKVKLRLAKLRHGHSFAVVAKGVRATVKGTVFNVGIATETVDVEVHEGLVRVEPVAGGWGMDVPSGFQVRVPFNNPEVPPMLLPLPAKHGVRVHVVPWPNLARMLATTRLLTVESKPGGADLFLNSSPVGTTNLTLRGAPGRHLVELFRDGKLAEQRWVELGGSRLLKVRMRGRVAMAPRLPARIHNFIRHRAVQIRGCYERHLKRDPHLQGRLTFRIGIDADGQVTEMKLLTNTFSDPRVGQCAQLTIRRWQFPPGKAVEVVYPFIFRPQ